MYKVIKWFGDSVGCHYWLKVDLKGLGMAMASHGTVLDAIEQLNFCYSVPSAVLAAVAVAATARWERFLLNVYFEAQRKV